MRSVTSDDEPVTNKVVDGPRSSSSSTSCGASRWPTTSLNTPRRWCAPPVPAEPDAPDFVNKLMSWGAGPRASLNLILAGKARAALRGRCHVSIEDIRELCLPILRHRIIPNFAARSEGMTPDTLIAKGCSRRSRPPPCPAESPAQTSRSARSFAPPMSVHLPQTHYLDPEVLQKLGDLELIAREVVEGLRVGSHRSPLRGFSTEFAHHRPYSPGDPIRTIDWRVFGRTERYYTKLYEAETNYDCHLLIDASASMSYASGKVSKLEYAKFLAASLAYIVLKQRDSVGLSVFDSEVRAYLPPRSTMGILLQIDRMLRETKPCRAPPWPSSFTTSR
jgi:hypothetical protein